MPTPLSRAVDVLDEIEKGFDAAKGVLKSKAAASLRDDVDRTFERTKLQLTARLNSLAQGVSNPIAAAQLMIRAQALVDSTIQAIYLLGAGQTLIDKDDIKTAFKPISTIASEAAEAFLTDVSAASGQATAPSARPPVVYASATSGLSTGSGTGLTAVEREVSRLLDDIVGRTTSNDPDELAAAIAIALPVGQDGSVSLAGTNGTAYGAARFNGGGAIRTAIVSGRANQLPSAQASLARQSTLLATDALSVLDGLEPLTLTEVVDLDRIRELKVMIRTAINGLVSEFGRIDGPIGPLVTSYFTALLGPPAAAPAAARAIGARGGAAGGAVPIGGPAAAAPVGHLAALGQAAQLGADPPAVTANDLRQKSDFLLLTNYASDLQQAYTRFVTASGTKDLSELLVLASGQMRIVTETKRQFFLAMDHVGFSDAERRSPASKVSLTLTVGGLGDWITQLVEQQGPNVLLDGGQEGLTFVKDQAGLLITEIASMLSSSASPAVLAVMKDPDVRAAAEELQTHLTALATI